MEEIRGDEYDTLKGKDNMQEQLFFMMKQATRSGLTTSTQQVAFLHLDVVDRQAPSQEQLCEGVNWISDKNKSGKGTVYVHCKAGRARSATLVAAYLMEVGAHCPPVISSSKHSPRLRDFPLRKQLRLSGRLGRISSCTSRTMRRLKPFTRQE